MRQRNATPPSPSLQNLQIESVEQSRTASQGHILGQENIVEDQYPPAYACGIFSCFDLAFLEHERTTLRTDPFRRPKIYAHVLKVPVDHYGLHLCVLD